MSSDSVESSISGTAFPTSPPSAAASKAEPSIRGITPRNAIIAASIVATLGVWAAAGWVWLDEYRLFPPHQTLAAASAQRPKAIERERRHSSTGRVAAASASHPSTTRSLRGGRGGAPSAPASFVVLPFANQSHNPGQEYFADAVTAGLTAELSQIPGSFVIARATAFSYQRKAADVVQIGRALKVRYVLAGGVEQEGERVHLTGRLVDDETGRPVWADQLATSRSDLAKAQDEFVRRMARALNLQFVPPTEPARTADPQARDLVMQGWAWCRRPYSVASWQEAGRAFAHALAIDPQSVDARIGLATVLGGRLAEGWGLSRQQDPARAERLLREALARDANNATAHFALGVLRQMQGRLRAAQVEYQTAIALDHNDARAYFHLGQTLMYLGDPRAAIPDFSTALLLDPRDPNRTELYWALGTAHLLLGRVDMAIDWLERARAANPRLWFPHLYLAASLALRGDVQPAKAELVQSLELNPAVNSLARMRFYNLRIAAPQYRALQKATLDVGLRRAGLPDGDGDGARL
ncbi:MAG TPA: tetratricopeptide repeat protein [Stellaceae bacterium]|nr:tetratricopeptide repeat protein [Stellaceae bacterium]